MLSHLPALLAFLSTAAAAYTGETGRSAAAHINDLGDVSAEGDAVNHPGMDATSKACRSPTTALLQLHCAVCSRYDDGPGWSDCDPFELIRFRVLRLIHGGSQCEEMKNITKHCTPHDFPYGTHWLIQASAAAALLWIIQWILAQSSHLIAQFAGAQEMYCRADATESYDLRPAQVH